MLGFGGNDVKTGSDADLVVVVDCQIPADDLVVHNLWLWEADGPAGKALKMGSQVKIMPLYPLGVFFADNMAGWSQQSPVHRPCISHVKRDVKLAQ